MVETRFRRKMTFLRKNAHRPVPRSSSAGCRVQLLQPLDAPRHIPRGELRSAPQGQGQHVRAERREPRAETGEVVRGALQKPTRNVVTRVSRRVTRTTRLRTSEANAERVGRSVMMSVCKHEKSYGPSPHTVTTISRVSPPVPRSQKKTAWSSPSASAPFETGSVADADANDAFTFSRK